MVDRVRAIKWEDPADGGTQLDQTPTQININEDYLDCRGVSLQSDTSEDDDVLLSRDASGNMTFTDPVYGATATLTELAAGGGESVIETRGILTTAGGIVYTPASGGGIAIVVKAAL
jgi:hypothetical protein